MKWKKVIKKIDEGKSFDEVTKDVPLAVKRIQKRFSQSQVSTKQVAAVKRG